MSRQVGRVAHAAEAQVDHARAVLGRPSGSPPPPPRATRRRPDDLRDQQLDGRRQPGDADAVVGRGGDQPGDERAVALGVAARSRRRSSRAAATRPANSGWPRSRPESITATRTGASGGAVPEVARAVSPGTTAWRERVVRREREPARARADRRTKRHRAPCGRARLDEQRPPGTTLARRVSCARRTGGSRHRRSADGQRAASGAGASSAPPPEERYPPQGPPERLTRPARARARRNQDAVRPGAGASAYAPSGPVVARHGRPAGAPALELHRRAREAAAARCRRPRRLHRGGHDAGRDRHRPHRPGDAPAESRNCSARRPEVRTFARGPGDRFQRRRRRAARATGSSAPGATPVSRRRAVGAGPPGRVEREPAEGVNHVERSPSSVRRAARSRPRRPGRDAPSRRTRPDGPFARAGRAGRRASLAPLPTAGRRHSDGPPAWTGEIELNGSSTETR